MKNIFKTIGLLVFALLGLSNAIYAKGKDFTDEFVIEYNFEEDEFAGPGIGLAVNTWNGTLNNVIYGYGDLNNIIGDEIVSGLAYACDGPGTESAKRSNIVYNAVGPGFLVNAFTKTAEAEYVDLGPQVSTAVVSPDDYVKLYNSTPKDLAEACVQLANAKKKDSKTSKTSKTSK